MSKNPKLIAVENYIKALCTHDLDAIRDLYADNASIEDPVGSEPISGMDAIIGFYKTAFSSGISARLAGEVRLTEHCAAFPFVVELNPGNGEMQLDVIDVFTFTEDNLIVDMKAYWGAENTRTP